MPIYEYICNHCRKSFDKLVSGPSASKPACPHCGSKNTAKQLSTINVGSSMPEACKTCPSQGAPRACPSGGMCRQY